MGGVPTRPGEDGYKARGSRGPWRAEGLLSSAVHMILLLLGVSGILLLLGLWGLLQGYARHLTLAPQWPPGPRPLPFLGNLHLLGVTQQDRALMEVG